MTVVLFSPTEHRPLHRYVTVDTTTNSETIIAYALAASFTGTRVNESGNPFNESGNPFNESIPCGDCSRLADQLSKNDSVCCWEICSVFSSVFHTEMLHSYVHSRLTAIVAWEAIR